MEEDWVTLTRQDYEDFLSRFSEKLDKGHRDVCFYLYGSYITGGFVSGVSDLDGGLILPGGPVSPRKKTLYIARCLDESLGDLNIDFDFNLLDRKTNNDGRFLSYSQSMTDHIQRSGKVFSGPYHFMDELNGPNYRNEDLKWASMVLRSLRNSLLSSYYDARIDYNDFKKRTKKNLQKAVKFPKQIVLVKHGELIAEKSVARARLGEMLRDYISDDVINHLENIDSVLRNKMVLDKLLTLVKNPSHLCGGWILGFFPGLTKPMTNSIL